MPDPSFDVVSEVDVQELRNATQQAQREIGTRFDFKGTRSSIELDDQGPSYTLRSNTEVKVAAVLDVLKDKLVKRHVSLKALEPKKVEPAAGGTFRQTVAVIRGISDERAKAITKEIRNLKLKVQAQVHGDRVRVTGKKKDDLQAIIAHLKTLELDYPIQFTNYR
jgi:cyclic-di-GMP-binding protein